VICFTANLEGGTKRHSGWSRRQVLGVAAAISAEGDAESKRSGTMEEGPELDR
jgi:hypothetical protein